MQKVYLSKTISRRQRLFTNRTLAWPLEAREYTKEELQDFCRHLQFELTASPYEPDLRQV